MFNIQNININFIYNKFSNLYNEKFFYLKELENNLWNIKISTTLWKEKLIIEQKFIDQKNDFNNKYFFYKTT